MDSEIQIFQNALDFSEIKTREAMIPRTEIVAVDINTTPKELVKIFTESGLSKILVYNENIDDILGYIHSFELLDRKSTRLNSSHVRISYAVFCLKKKKQKQNKNTLLIA